MATIDINIVLDNPRDIFFSGETISGNLVVHLEEPIAVKCICIEMDGKAKTHWTAEKKHFFGNDKMFHSSYPVFGGSGDPMELGLGGHMFPFTVQLPLNAPPSYQDAHSSIEYRLRAKIQNHQAQQILNVCCPLDLNCLPKLQSTLRAERSQHYCCFWCLWGPVTLTATIPSRGCVPGQKLSLTVEMDNTSNVVIRSISYQLLKVVTYYSNICKNTQKYMETVVQEVIELADTEEDSGIWMCDVRIPRYVTPTFKNKCKLIDLEYLIRVKAKPAEALREVQIDLPIVIGTVPFLRDKPSGNHE